MILNFLYFPSCINATFFQGWEMAIWLFSSWTCDYFASCFICSGAPYQIVMYTTTKNNNFLLHPEHYFNNGCLIKNQRCLKCEIRPCTYNFQILNCNNIEHHRVLDVVLRNSDCEVRRSKPFETATIWLVAILQRECCTIIEKLSITVTANGKQ